MATPDIAPTRRPRLRSVISVCLALALSQTVGHRLVQAAQASPKPAIVDYQLVTATEDAGVTEYVFRARLFNPGPPIPGAVAMLAKAPEVVAVPDGLLVFGPVGHDESVWSRDTATIRRQGSWTDGLSTLRWSVKVVAGNRPPTADAGADRSARVGDRVGLDGGGSTDPDGDPLIYRWSFEVRPAGSVAELSDPAGVRPEFTVDLPGRYVIALAVHDGFTWSAPDIVEVSTENTAPVADAGDDRTTSPGAPVQLDGSRSFDADGDALTFGWVLLDRPAGSQASLDDAAAVRPMLLVDAPGIYVLQLTVHDGQTSSAPDTVTVRTDNSPPTADAGPDLTTGVGQEVVLDGSASTDVDGDPLTWAWSLVATPPGSTAVLHQATAVMPSFVADVPGDYVAQLIVNDGSADSAPDTVTISTANSAPVADAGPDQTVAAGQVVALDGSGSTDADGDPLSYRWTLVARPAGSAAAVADAGAAVTSFVADRPGDYVVQLVVNDGQLDGAPDAAVISTTNSAPVADAGADRVDVPIGSAVTLDGSASSDADGHPLSFTWSLTSRPSGSVAVLSDPTTPTPALVVDTAGDYLAQLIVNDGFVDSAADTVRVTVEPAPVVVAIDATDDTATEAGDVGVFTISRTGDLSSQLTVDLAILGTATNGVDYQTLPSSVVIPAGAAALAITVVPIDDGDLEGREGVTLRLSAGTGYVVGDPASAVVTIADDDTLVSVVASDAVASEDGPGAGAFTVSRLGPADDPLTVFYSLAGTAEAGLDYLPLSGNVTLPAGAVDEVVTITPIDDALLEGPEVVTMRIETGSGYQVGAVDQANLTIEDDERPAVTIVVSDDTAGESGPDPGAFLVMRTGPTTGPLVVAFTTAGDATEGLDYESLGGSVTIPTGASTASVAIVPIDDALIEGAETVVVSLASGPAYQVVVPGIAGLSIADDDLGVVTIEATDPAASEAGLDPGRFTLRRSGDTAATLRVLVAIAGTAADTDYEPLGLPLVFAAGADELSVVVTPRADNLVEGAEHLTLSIQPSLDYVVGAPSSATVTMADDPAIVSIEAPSPVAREAGLAQGAFLLTRRGGNVAASLTVGVSIGGTAGPNRDYVVLSGVATFPAGQTTLTVPVVPLPDNVVEDDEMVVMTMVDINGAGYLVGSPSTATVTIADDPVVVQVSVTDGEASEAGLDPGTVTFTRTGGDLSSALNVFFNKSGTATNGADYQNLGGAVSLVVIPAGGGAASVTIAPVADNLVEGQETAILTLVSNTAYVVGAASDGAVTIDDDPPVVSITSTDPEAAESGGDPGVFTFTRSGGNLSAALTVSFTRIGTATNGSDFVTIPTSITIPAGQVSAALTIVPIDDAAIEGTETVTLTVNASGTVVVGASASATVTIADNE